MKKSLSIGVILIFLLSALAPLSLGGNIRISSIDTPKVERSVYPFEDPPNEVWNKTYGGDKYDNCDYLQQTSDGGYIITGYTKSYGAGDFDIWLLKTDIDGNEQWNITYGGIKEDIGHCVRETSDNGFIITGYKTDNEDTASVWLIKTDNLGELTWEQEFSKDNCNAFGQRVIELEDGYLILGNVVTDDVYAKSDIWLIKTDFEGNEIWSKFIGDVKGVDLGSDVIQTNEGDFVVVGGTFTFNEDKVLLIKTDSYGEILWRKLIDGWEGFDIKECDNGDYIIAGREHVCLIRTDTEGNLIWKKEYQWGGFDVIVSVDFTSDGGYISTGGVLVSGEGNVIIIKTDENGNREWEKSIGGTKMDGGSYVIQSNDNTYIIGGTTKSYSDNGDFWLIKVAPFENQRPSKPIIDGPENGRPLIKYTYNVSASEPDDEQLFYWYEWGDNTYSPWEGPFESGETYETTKTWAKKGIHKVSVKARDPYGGDSEWTTLEVTIPRTKATFNSLLRLLDSYPILKEVLLRLIR